jgi:hypothetical protein
LFALIKHPKELVNLMNGTHRELLKNVKLPPMVLNMIATILRKT